MMHQKNIVKVIFCLALFLILITCRIEYIMWFSENKIIVQIPKTLCNHYYHCNIGTHRVYDQKYSIGHYNINEDYITEYQNLIYILFPLKMLFLISCIIYYLFILL